jgi:hypothetical protein
VLLDESDGGEQHLLSRRLAAELMILARQFDHLDRLAGAAQGVAHDPALHHGHGGVVLAVDQQDRRVRLVGQLGGRQAAKVSAGVGVNAQELALVAQGVAGRPR